jgi:hypothetical protein
MKKSIVFFLSFLFVTAGLMAQNTPKSTAETVENEIVKISYGAPSVRGRVVFGKLVPYGEVWRTGANNATEITLKKDARIAGKTVKAGTYSLFTIPGEKEWTIILNSELKQWGSYNYSKIKDKNVLEAKVAAQPLTDLVEKMTISVGEEAIILSWEKTLVSIPLN